MTARDDAIEAALDQMWTCCADCAKETVNRDANRPEAERLVDAVESIIRADERERAAAEGVRIARVTLDIARDDLAAEVRERLRAQVKALRHEDECDVSRGRERPETGMAECNCLRADVLDLLGGESE